MKCGCCKKEFESELKANGTEYKTCLSCREKDKEKKERNKCSHGKIRSQCKDCGGSQICEHNKIRSRCKDCGGSSICEHNKRRSRCKDCGGSSICEHNKIRSTCKDCGGGGICEHNKIRSTCKDCGGGSICEHNKRRSRCITCSPSRACQECKHVYVAPSYRFHPYCFTCYCVLNPDIDIPKKYKLKEHHFREFLREEYKEVKLIFDKSVGESNRRPDVLIPFGEYNITIEVDENQHRGYDCENRRTMEIFQDLGNKPMVVIRLNPDCYLDSFGKRVPGCFKITKTAGWKLEQTEWKRRLNIIKSKIDYFIKNNPEKELTLIYLFYNEIDTEQE